MGDEQSQRHKMSKGSEMHPKCNIAATDKCQGEEQHLFVCTSC
jgi:hypothetical protein